MSEHSSMYTYLNWTKQRLDEMDAALASLEANADKHKADTKAKADQLIADLKKRREEFQAKAKAQAEASEAGWQAAKAQLESQWNGFQAQVETYFETVSNEVAHQQDAFRDIATAQMKAWREAADKFQGAAAKVAIDRRADIEAAVKKMKADASEAEVRLQELKEAGKESWTALSGALAESRKAFDGANQTASDALKRVTRLHA